MSGRARTAAIVGFVLVVIALFVRHHRELDRRNVALAALVKVAREKDERRIAAIAEARATPARGDAAERPCTHPRSRIVRLESPRQIGGELRDLLEAIEAQREPKEPRAWTRELDVIDGGAFLYDYAEERVVCIGKDAEDPHGTLVAYEARP